MVQQNTRFVPKVLESRHGRRSTDSSRTNESGRTLAANRINVDEKGGSEEPLLPKKRIILLEIIRDHWGRAVIPRRSRRMAA
jgi:hypothetical protein